MNKKRVLLVENHPIVVQGYTRVINSEPDLQVCGDVASEDDAYFAIKEYQPHLLVIELGLNSGHGIELVKQIGTAIKVLVISRFEESLFAERVIDAGAKGFINKQAPLTQLLAGIRDVLNGKLYLSDKMTQHLLHRTANHSNSSDPLCVLSDREFEVFEMLGRGLNTKTIAGELSLSPNTVYRYRENIKVKLAISDSVLLIQRATQWALENS